MEIFVERLQQRAGELGLTQAEVARLSGLNERRFNHYARGRRQPDLATLVRISQTLKTTPNWLLGVEPSGEDVDRSKLEASLSAACQSLDRYRLGLAVSLVTALAKHEAPDAPRVAGGGRKQRGKRGANR